MDTLVQVPLDYQYLDDKLSIQVVKPLREIALQVLDWFSERKMSVYSVSCGSALLYNNIFPKHKERLNKRMSELVRGRRAQDRCITAYRKRFSPPRCVLQAQNN
jgi:hypothetical protein